MIILFEIPSGSWRHKSSSVTTNKVTSGGTWIPSAYSNNITCRIINVYEHYGFDMTISINISHHILQNK